MLDVVKTDTSANSGCGQDALKDPPYSQLILCKDGGSPRDSSFSVSLSSTKYHCTRENLSFPIWTTLPCTLNKDNYREKARHRPTFQNLDSNMRWYSWKLLRKFRLEPLSSGQISSGHRSLNLSNLSRFLVLYFPSCLLHFSK